MAAELFGQGLTLGGVRVTAIEQDLSSSSQSALPSTYAVQQAIAAIALTGANPGEIYNIKSYGAVANAVVPASGNVVTGTSIHTALNNCIAAAPSNAIVLIPAGNYLCSTAPTAITTKRLNIIVLGNIYTNGANFLTFSGPGGADRQHTVEILGSVIGAVNLPAHSKTAYDTATGLNAPTGYNWASLTGAAITINQNVNSMHVRVNLIEGFQSGILMTQGGGNGSQENTFAVQKMNKNNYGIHLKSTDGVSWCDKNIFTGFDGGHLRITGNIALNIDGYSGAASTNSENYNGAFRSNKFQFLAESVNQVVALNGDITENKFDITIEGGTTTGVFGSVGIQSRSVSPNYVRAPKWEGQGVLGTQWMTNGMGIDGTIDMPIWLGSGSLAYIGNKARIDSSGNIFVEVRQSLSAANRSALPSNFRTVSVNSTGNCKRITDANYTVVDGDYSIIIYNQSAARTVTLPAASAYPHRMLWIVQQKGNGNTLNLSQSWMDNSGATSAVLLNDNTICIHSDGTQWNAVSEHL